MKLAAIHEEIEELRVRFEPAVLHPANQPLQLLPLGPREQRDGRALLWDKQIDRQVQAEFKAAFVAQQPYVYQTKGE